MSGLYMVIGTLIALGVLVTFHEFGHFWVARRCGVIVQRFSIGFGKPLLRWRDKRGTEFVIAAIPLGGYVKMLDEREGNVPDHLLDHAFNRKSVRQRIAIVAAGPLANFLLAFVFFWILAMLGSTHVRPVIGSVTPESLAAQAGLGAHQELIEVDGDAVNSWSAVGLRLLHRIGESGEIDLKVRDVQSGAESSHQIHLQDWLRGANEPDPILSLGIHPWRPEVPARLAQLDPKGPARKAGLQIGDQIVAIDGESMPSWQSVVERIRVSPGKAIELMIERQGAQQSFDLTLSTRGEGDAAVGYLGAGVSGVDWPPEMLREIRYGPLDAVGQGIQRTWNMTTLTLQSLKKMLFGELSVKNLSGPITIAKVAGASAQSGVGDFLNFLAYLSISLGVLNLLPIPVLDGGHLLFYGVEWIRGRPLSERVQAWGMQIGISLVMCLMLFALFNDLTRL